MYGQQNISIYIYIYTRARQHYIRPVQKGKKFALNLSIVRFLKKINKAGNVQYTAIYQTLSVQTCVPPSNGVTNFTAVLLVTTHTHTCPPTHARTSPRTHAHRILPTCSSPFVRVIVQPVLMHENNALNFPGRHLEAKVCRGWEEVLRETGRLAPAAHAN